MSTTVATSSPIETESTAPISAANALEERRAAPRRSQRVFQWIAPCIGDRLPDQSMFYPVQCVDISTAGIAFFTDEPLPSQECIVALGTTENAFYVRARIIDCQPHADQQGMRYRIGCEFTERFGKPDVPVAKECPPRQIDSQAVTAKQ